MPGVPRLQPAAAQVVGLKWHPKIWMLQQEVWAQMACSLGCLYYKHHTDVREVSKPARRPIHPIWICLRNMQGGWMGVALRTQEFDKQ